MIKNIIFGKKSKLTESIIKKIKDTQVISILLVILILL